MKIGIYHGYNITGSGSNEYTRYLARTFLEQGHTVDIICREYHPEKIDFIGQVWQWDRQAICNVVNANPAFIDRCRLHQIPYGDFYPVYISDKKQSTVFKEFVDLTDEELNSYKALNHKLLKEIFAKIDLDILHANHLVMQPSLATESCQQHKIPFIIFPHGSDIEYTVKKDPRYQGEARQAIIDCSGLIIGNKEVRDRICHLFPDIQEMIIDKTTIVGVGVDTNLFKPVSKSNRTQIMLDFTSQLSMQESDGKTPELTAELLSKLQQQCYSAITTYDNAYDHNSVDADTKQKLLSIDFSNPVLLFVGALTAGKGLQSLICALPQIYQTYPKLQLLIIGKGAFREVLESFIYALAEQDQVLLSYLTESRFVDEESEEADLWLDVNYYLAHLADKDNYFSSAKKLLSQIIFLGRFNHTQLSKVFPCADIAVFPSVIPEAYPLVLMESLANGVLPVVSYFSGFKDGVDELSRHLNEDLLTHMKIPVETKTRIETIANNINILLPLLQKNDISIDLAKIARENYDWSHRAVQLTAAYSALLPTSTQ